MKLVDIIIDIFETEKVPLKQGDIHDFVIQHPSYNDCDELKRVKVPASAVARCLTKYTSGSNPIFGIENDGKQKIFHKKYFLRNKDMPVINEITETSLHPYLVKFAKARFNVYCKTINALKVLRKKDKIGRWTNPDIVGISPVLLNLNDLFQKEVEKLGMLSTKVMQFYSFELKLK